MHADRGRKLRNSAILTPSVSPWPGVPDFVCKKTANAETCDFWVITFMVYFVMGMENFSISQLHDESGVIHQFAFFLGTASDYFSTTKPFFGKTNILSDGRYISHFKIEFICLKTLRKRLLKLNYF
jgi:hypothetical protein